MDVSNLLSGEASNHDDSQHRSPHPYATRNTSSSHPSTDAGDDHPHGSSAYYSTRATQPPKPVAFALILSKSQGSQARLPLRVNIHPHDTTDSIISTVKNFYGLYEANGVAFEDDTGTNIIPRYENVHGNDTIHVRITKEVDPEESSEAPSLAQSRRNSMAKHTDPNILPSHALGGDYSTLQAIPDHCSTGGVVEDPSDSENGSRRAKSDNLASAEISVDNILEGNRRKKAKFESSELPLYIPPQMPTSLASMSSASPQKLPPGAVPQSPVAKPYTSPYPGLTLPSPISHPGPDFSSKSYSGKSISSRAPSGGGPQMVPPKKSRNVSGPMAPLNPRNSDSLISDEDVALQLMRLGDASNFSYGRGSNSTADDALSGKAEVASSADDTDDGSEGENMRPSKKQRMGAASDEEDGVGNAPSQGGRIQDGSGAPWNGIQGSRSKAARPPKTQRIKKAMKPLAPSSEKQKSAPGSASKIPPSPYSLPPNAGRRSSIGSTAASTHHFGTDEEDLSSKPRCQRCRKSKKGCDRQRPCQRCKDAGIGIEGCVSEDEGNGRKGKYGRHMGIAVKKTSIESMDSVEPEAMGAKKRKR